VSTPDWVTVRPATITSSTCRRSSTAGLRRQDGGGLDDRGRVLACGGEHLKAGDIVVHPVLVAAHREPRVGARDHPHASVPQQDQP
jgi:hypothetical protein